MKSEKMKKREMKYDYFIVIQYRYRPTDRWEDIGHYYQQHEKQSAVHDFGEYRMAITGGHTSASFRMINRRVRKSFGKEKQNENQV